MKKQVLILLLFGLTTGNFCKVQAENDLGKQLIKNIHFSWDVDKTDDYRWRNIYIGTGYGQDFKAYPRAFWLINVDYNWSKYTLYADGDYAMGVDNVYLKTQSISFPTVVGYNVYKSSFTNLQVFTGPVYEMILSSKLDGDSYSNLTPIQWGWTIGTKIRFFGMISARLAYSLYPTGLFHDGSLNRSGVTFTLGF